MQKKKIGKKKTVKKLKSRLTKEEKAYIRKQNAFSDKIEKVFCLSGFLSIKTKDIEFKIGNRDRNEVDLCFVYENIILICEDTLRKTDIKDHIRHKVETAKEILANPTVFLDFLNKRSTKFDKNAYSTQRWKFYFLYFSNTKIDLSKEDLELFKPLNFVKPSSLEYFVKMSRSIKKSFRYEIFRYLRLNKKDIGRTDTGTGATGIEVAIIHPDDVTGINEGVHLVSFMISAGDLLRNSYVLRKDNWEESYALYQRLITAKRIKNIREFVIKKQRTFYNNIIVSLPKNIVFKKADQSIVDISKLDAYDNYNMTIPDEFNSIGIIDGQHRVFAYYEDEESNKDEIEISKMRNKLHLLVTGLIFPDEWSDSKKREFESDIFLQINRNAKMVEKDVILHIEATRNRYSDISIARQVLVKMNENGPFKDLFQLSLVESAPIKTASIIQFALCKLVRPDIATNGLYKYWSPKDIVKEDKLINNDNALDEYIDFCVASLNTYFGAIKSVYKEDWNMNSKLLRIVSINAFIIALHNTIENAKGMNDFDYYKSIFQKEKIDFTGNDFPYSGSKYAQFSKDKIEPLLLANGTNG